MKKKLFLLITIFLLNIAAWAQQDRVIVIYLLDTTKSQVQMDSHPVITFDDENVIIKSEGATMQYPSKDVLKITYEVQNPSFVKDLSFKQDGNFIVFDNIVQESDIRIYTIEGKAIQHSIVNIDGRCAVPISSLSKGIYVLKVNNKGIKIYKK